MEAATVKAGKSGGAALSRVVPPVLVVVLIPVAVWLAPEVLSAQSIAIENIARLLALLLFVALLIERALEVFLTTWRAAGSEALDQAIRERKSQLAGGESDSLRLELQQVEQRKLTYRATTRNVAMWSALILGILASVAGLRALGSLVDAASVSGLPRLQQILFRSIDVLLTGGVIAGGSDGIHKLAQIYKNFTESTANRARAGGS